MSTAFDIWQDGKLTDIQALRALCRDLGEVESQLAPLEAERAALRDQISHVLDRLGGTTEITGFGKLEITAPSIVKSYDKKRLDQLLIDLAAEAPELVARIAACRTESARAGSLRITRQKQL